jgi:chromosome segregation ATPase
MRIRKKSVLSKQKKEPTISDVILHIQKYATSMEGEMRSMKKELLGRMGTIEGKIVNLEIDVRDLKQDVGEVKEKAEIIQTNLDNLTHKVESLENEKGASFANYQEVEEKVEQHDKDITKIKLKVGMA